MVSPGAVRTPPPSDATVCMSVCLSVSLSVSVYHNHRYQPIIMILSDGRTSYMYKKLHDTRASPLVNETCDGKTLTTSHICLHVVKFQCSDVFDEIEYCNVM